MGRDRAWSAPLTPGLVGADGTLKSADVVMTDPTLHRQFVDYMHKNYDKPGSLANVSTEVGSDYAGSYAGANTPPGDH